MKRMINFGSIGQFRNVVKAIQTDAQFMSLAEDGNPIYDRLAKMPILTGYASEKIHGSNGAVCFNSQDGFWAQSKSNIITPQKDNAGCAFAADQNKEHWMWIIHYLAEQYNIDMFDNIISVYFEWSGGSIQKKSACTGLDKRAIIFQHFKVSPREPEFNEDGKIETQSYWLETKIGDIWASTPSVNIYNIMNYKTWTFKIDFETPLLSQNQMLEQIEALEANSPYGQAMGCENNIGEGMVVTFEYKGKVHKFKIKGEKHSASKVKTLKPVDEVKEQAKIDFANYACSAARLEQAWQAVFGIENEIMEPTVKATGDFIRAVIQDVMKEELDILAEKELEPKEVNSKISLVARRWFMEELDKDAGINN